MSKKSAISSARRARILARDNYICRACGFGGDASYDPFLEADHAIAESKGGETSDANLQCLCTACNGWKGNKNYYFPRIRIDAAMPEDWAFNHRIIKTFFTAREMDIRRLRKLR